MTRIAIDHDADGAYAVITRPGQAAERVELTHAAVARLAEGAMGAWLAEEAARGRAAVTPARWPREEFPKNDGDYAEAMSTDVPLPFIGALGE